MKRMTNRRGRRRNAELKNYQPTSAPLCVLRGRNLFAQLKTAVDTHNAVEFMFDGRTKRYRLAKTGCLSPIVPLTSQARSTSTSPRMLRTGPLRPWSSGRGGSHSFARSSPNWGSASPQREAFSSWAPAQASWRARYWNRCLRSYIRHWTFRRLCTHSQRSDWAHWHGVSGSSSWTSRRHNGRTACRRTTPWLRCRPFTSSATSDTPRPCTRLYGACCVLEDYFSYATTSAERSAWRMRRCTCHLTSIGLRWVRQASPRIRCATRTEWSCIGRRSRDHRRRRQHGAHHRQPVAHSSPCGCGCK